MWLGGLHMNIHKLLENVLLHCELFLGQALLFTKETRAGAQEAVELAEENLKGCMAKRMLEVPRLCMSHLECV